MRTIKYIFILLVVLFIGYLAGWYYIASLIKTDINSQYAGQKINIKGLNQEEYFVSFDKITSRGFPFEMSISVHGWQEESRGAIISYKAPVNIGYNFISQVAYISYNGEIDAAYKPIAHGFGAILKITDYLVDLSLPLNKDLLTNLRNIKDPVEIINYIGDINLSTQEVQIFDKQENELFYDKDHERLKFSFVRAKHYENLDDLLNNIPKEYKIDYLVKTKPVKFTSRRIPVSLFYGFSILPANFDAAAHVEVSTSAQTIKELYNNLEVKAQATFAGEKVNVSSLKINFKGDLDLLRGRDMKLLVDGKIRLEEGLFDELFSKYELVAPSIASAAWGHLINQEMRYIIANKDAFKFKNLENSDYDLNLDISSAHNTFSSSVKLNNFSIYSGDSGFKLTNDSLMKQTNHSNWHSTGVLLIKNYPAVIEFSSGYIYRFGKFRFLNDQARRLYIDVNKDFLKAISDYPTSTSNDLSFDYELNSDNIDNAKIGSAKISQIIELYQLMIYKKLFATVDPHGNILAQMKKILPDLDEHEPMFEKLLPKITGKTIKELLPPEAKNGIEQAVPIKELKKKIGKDLLKGLGQ